MTPEAEPAQLRVLRGNHATWAAFHLITAVVFWIVAPKKNVCMPATYVTLDRWNVTNATFGNECVSLIQESEPVARVNQLYLALFSPIWSGLVHLCVATFRWKHYLALLKQGRFLYRWVDYAISAPPMMVLITQLCGIAETWVLVNVGLTTFVTVLLGSMDDTRNVDRVPLRLSMWLLAALVHGVGSWGPPLDAISRAANVPGAVVAVVSVMCLGFFSFGIVQLVYILVPGIVYECEMAYNSLSGTAKSILQYSLLATVLVLTPTDRGINTTHVALSIAVPVFAGFLTVALSIHLWRRAGRPSTAQYGSILTNLRK